MREQHNLIDDFSVLESLRQHRQQHRKLLRPLHQVPISDKAVLSLGQRVSDAVASVVGSWKFIIIQTLLISTWITYNAQQQSAWDPYPFILLNLLLSFQAAYTAPAIMMSQNRQAEIDRQRAENDFEVNVKAELEIELLHKKIDILMTQLEAK
jgi:uncharacterized membrane protein